MTREDSIMHTILSTQLKPLQVSDTIKQSIQPLSLILEAITKAGQEDEGDPLTTTIEALRAITQFNPNSGGENSESSSEYTTPAQSQTTSPSHEQSPPPPGVSMQTACATVGSAAKLLTMQNNGENHNSSPTTSPTHCERVSSLATHSHHAGKSHSHSSTGARYRSSQSAVENSLVLDVPSSPRRKSDSELQKHRVRPASQQIQTSSSVGETTRHGHSRSIDYAIK